jgi:NADH-quinone oxidoreductase subunit M
VAFGELVHEDVKKMPDLSAREMLLLAPIAAAVMWMGIYPESFMAPIRGDVGAIVARIDRAAPEGDAHLKMGKAKAAISKTATDSEVDASHGETH